MYAAVPRNGIGVNVWTVNEEEDMRRMKKWGVNSIITNYPDRGRAVQMRIDTAM